MGNNFSAKIGIDAFRAVAGNETSIGYAVLNEKGDGVEKAENHKFLTSHNVKVADESVDHAYLREFLFEDVKNSVLQSGGGQGVDPNLQKSRVEDFLERIRQELGVARVTIKGDGEAHPGEKTVFSYSTKPLERRTIRAVLDAMDLFNAETRPNNNLVLTEKEARLAALLSRNDFTVDKTNPVELLRLANAVDRVATGRTIAETVTVGGMKMTLACRDDGQLRIHFKSGHFADVDVNAGFVDAALGKAFSNTASFDRHTLQRVLADLRARIDDLPVLDQKAQFTGGLAMTIVQAAFPTGLDENDLALLSPKMKLKIAEDVSAGHLSTAKQTMEQVKTYLGRCNALTGEERQKGGENGLGRPVDQNINTQENDYLVSKFLDLQKEEQDRVKFQEGVRENAPAVNASPDEVDEIFRTYKEEFEQKGGLDKMLLNKSKEVVSNVAKGAVNIFASLFSASESLTEDDLESCVLLFGKNKEVIEKKPQEFSFWGAIGSFFSPVKPQNQAKPGEKPPEAGAQQPAPEKPEIKTAFTPEEVRAFLQNDDKRAFVIKLLCEAGEDNANLAVLEGYEKQAAGLIAACRELDEFKGLDKTLFAHNQEKELAAALEAREHPLAGKRADDVVKLADKFMNLPPEKRNDEGALSLLLYNPKNCAVAAKLLACRDHLGDLPVQQRAKVMELCRQLEIALKNFDVRSDGSKAAASPLLLRPFNEGLIAEKLKKEFVDDITVKMPLTDKQLQSCRTTFADLLQDADTWEMDKRADTPGARLGYSLEKHAADLALLICNPHAASLLGEPAAQLAETLTSLLRDHVLTDDLRAQFHAGNEATATKLLLGVLRSDAVKRSLPTVEKLLDEKIALNCRELQAVTSGLFAKMLAGADKKVNTEQIKQDFAWLTREIAYSAFRGAQTKVQAADVALDLIAALPEGMTVGDFKSAYSKLFDLQALGEKKNAQFERTSALLAELAKYPGRTVDDLLLAAKCLHAVQTGRLLDKVENYEEAVKSVIARLPAEISMADYYRAFEAYYGKNDPELAGKFMPGRLGGEARYFEPLDTIAQAALESKVSMADFLALADKFKNEPNKRLADLPPMDRTALLNNCRDCFARRPENIAPENFMEDFSVCFDAPKVTGDAANAVAKTDKALACLARIPAGRRAADLIATLNEAKDLDEALLLLNKLPSFRTRLDMTTVVDLLSAEGVAIDSEEAIYALAKLSGPAEDVGRNLAYVMKLAGKGDDDKPFLPFKEAVKLLSLGGNLNAIRYAVDNVDDVIKTRNDPTKAPPTDWEKLAMAALAQVAGWREKGSTWVTPTALEQFFASLNVEGGLKPDSLAAALGKIAEPADVPDPAAAAKGAQHGQQHVVRQPKNTPSYDPAAARYRNLVQMLRENGMEKEADEIDVEIAYPEDIRPEARSPQLVNEFNAECQKLAKRRLELSRLLLQKMGASATDTTKGYGQFMCKAMNRYFRSLGAVDSRTMFAAACRYAKSDDPMALLGATLKGAGPIMQKMLQGLAAIEELPEDFRMALADMRSNLADIPQTEVRAQLHELVRQSNGAVESITVTKPLGAASVGQAFLCQMKMKGEENPRSVVVKILRPDALPRVQREKDVFIAASKEVDGMEVTFAGQLAGIMEELDLRQEAKNVELGKAYDLGAGDVKSMKLVPGVPTLRNAMVVECAPGTTADRFFRDTRQAIAKVVQPFREAGEKAKLPDGRYSGNVHDGDAIQNMMDYAKAQQSLMRLYTDTLVQQKRLVKLVEKWANEGIYNGGFYHGDLHAGNIMLDPVKRDENGNVIPDSGVGGLTVIDFGNATQLTAKQQKAVMRMMMAATLRNTDRFLDNFAELMTPEGRRLFTQNRNQGQKIHDLVHEILHLGSEKDAEKRIFAILQRLMLLGYEMPGAVYKFAQCTIRLQGTVAECNNVLEDIRKEMYKLNCMKGAAHDLPDCDPLAVFEKNRYSLGGRKGGYDDVYDLTGYSALPNDEHGRGYGYDDIVSSAKYYMDSRLTRNQRGEALELIEGMFTRYVANANVGNDQQLWALKNDLEKDYAKLREKMQVAIDKQKMADEARNTLDSTVDVTGAEKEHYDVFKQFEQRNRRENFVYTLLDQLREGKLGTAEKFKDLQTITKGTGQLEVANAMSLLTGEIHALEREIGKNTLPPNELQRLRQQLDEKKAAFDEARRKTDDFARLTADTNVYFFAADQLLEEDPNKQQQLLAVEAYLRDNAAQVIDGLEGDAHLTQEELNALEAGYADKDDKQLCDGAYTDVLKPLLTGERPVNGELIRRTLRAALRADPPQFRLAASLYKRWMHWKTTKAREEEAKRLNYPELSKEAESVRTKVLGSLKSDAEQPNLTVFVKKLCEFYAKTCQQKLAEMLNNPRDNPAVPHGPCKLNDFFDAIGEVISSHIDQDLLNLNFHGGALNVIKSTGLFFKGIPSIVATVNRFGVKLAGSAIADSGNQVPD